MSERVSESERASERQRERERRLTVRVMITSDDTDEFGPGPPIDSLRWLGAPNDPAGREWHQPDDAAVQRLRAKLQQNNGGSLPPSLCAPAVLPCLLLKVSVA